MSQELERLLGRKLFTKLRLMIEVENPGRREERAPLSARARETIYDMRSVNTYINRTGTGPILTFTAQSGPQNEQNKRRIGSLALPRENTSVVTCNTITCSLHSFSSYCIDTKGHKSVIHHESSSTSGGS
ncbi:hypothetical protein J6590_027006 [Homalodisca vitripennis]|nr:hypothetical protein J6590_027006 [Homalodisca vitripennis]